MKMTFRSIGDVLGGGSWDGYLGARTQEFKELLANNVWEYKPEEFLVTYSKENWDEPIYYLKLDMMSTAERVLEAISTVSSKSWATPLVVGDLVILLDRVLGLDGYEGGRHPRWAGGGAPPILPSLP